MRSIILGGVLMACSMPYGMVYGGTCRLTNVWATFTSYDRNNSILEQKTKRLDTDRSNLISTNKYDGSIRQPGRTVFANYIINGTGVTPDQVISSHQFNTITNEHIVIPKNATSVELYTTVENPFNTYVVNFNEEINCEDGFDFSYTARTEGAKYWYSGLQVDVSGKYEFTSKLGVTINPNNIKLHCLVGYDCNTKFDLYIHGTEANYRLNLPRVNNIRYKIGDVWVDEYDGDVGDGGTSIPLRLHNNETGEQTYSIPLTVTVT
ncbi:hypothetical protein A15U_04656 [Escherichia coli KTE210]|nr:hypothetical protein A15U_04656 [Escherichia coli KTE210]